MLHHHHQVTYIKRHKSPHTSETTSINMTRSIQQSTTLMRIDIGSIYGIAKDIYNIIELNLEPYLVSYI